MRNVAKIVLSPIRENISLSVLYREASPGDESNMERSYEYVLQNLFTSLLENPQAFATTIIYVNNFHWCGFAYELGHQILGTNFYVGGEARPGCERVQQYHAHLAESVCFI